MSESEKIEKSGPGTMTISKTQANRQREFHTSVWSSGTRGGGKVPADLEWTTNPKQWQEENGAGVDKKD